MPIHKRVLTGYLKNVWRFERGDESTGEVVSKLNIKIGANKDYIVQTGFETNFARTFLAGLLELELEALAEPVTLVVEDNAGSKARTTVFYRIESKSVRMTPSVNREMSAEGLYNEARAKFDFTNSYTLRTNEGVYPNPAGISLQLRGRDLGCAPNHNFERSARSPVEGERFRVRASNFLAVYPVTMRTDG